MGDALLTARSGAVITMSLNRPERLNAFDRTLQAALHAALETAASDRTCRAVLLRGEGRGFSAGQDLADLGDQDDLGTLLEQGYAPTIRLIRTMPKPVVCAVHGMAAGAGANLAFACDIVLAARSARFIQAFIRIGLIPDVGGTWFLPRLVGDARARAMAMLGDPVEAPQAESWGLIWRAVPDASLHSEAEALAARLAELPTEAIARMKKAFDAAETNTLDQQLTLENNLQRELGRATDFAEGKRAFLEKRAPRFTGSAA